LFIVVKYLIYQRRTHIATRSNIHVALIGISVKSSHMHKETCEEFNKSLKDDRLIDLC